MTEVLYRTVLEVWVLYLLNYGFPDDESDVHYGKKNSLTLNVKEIRSEPSRLASWSSSVQKDTL